MRSRKLAAFNVQSAKPLATIKQVQPRKGCFSASFMPPKDPAESSSPPVSQGRPGLRLRRCAASHGTCNCPSIWSNVATVTPVRRRKLGLRCRRRAENYWGAGTAPVHRRTPVNQKRPGGTSCLASYRRRGQPFARGLVRSMACAVVRSVRNGF